MKKLTLIIGIFLIAVGVAVAQDDEPVSSVVTVDQVINPHTADAMDYVSDMAKVFTYPQENYVNMLCLRMDREAKIQTLVVTVPSIGDADPFQYSVDLFQRIGVGDKNTNRGLLILVAVNDHKWEIRTGYGIEGQFTDAICSYVGRNKMVPKFKEEDYAGGIKDAVDYFMTLATNEKALEELNMELENQAKLQEAQDTRDAIYGLWVLIVIWLLITYGTYRMMRPSKKAKGNKEDAASEAASADVALKEGAPVPAKWSCGEEMIPQKFQVTSTEGDVIRVKEAKNNGIKYWDKNKPTRWLLYFGGPSLATGAVCEITQDMDMFFLMILVCNTWAAIVYFVSRFNMAKRAVTSYEKHRVYDEGIYGGKMWAFLIFVPWVTIPALIFGAGERKKYKTAGPPCPECGCDMFEDDSEEDMLKLLSEKEVTERRLATKYFKLYKCANGHNMLDVRVSKGSYKECEKCGTIAAKVTSQKTIQRATYTSTGKRLDIYKCQHCGAIFTVSVVLPRLERSSSSSGGRSGGGGGGSYGGGSTGGGGAGGSW